MTPSPQEDNDDVTRSVLLDVCGVQTLVTATEMKKERSAIVLSQTCREPSSAV